MLTSTGSPDPFTRLNVIAMQIQGLWPVPFFGKKISAVHRTFGVFITVCYGLFTVSLLADVFISRDDLEAVLRNLSISLLYLSGTVKAFSFLFTRDTVHDLVKHSGEFSRRVRSSGDPKSIEVFDEYVKHGRVLTYLFWIAAGLTISGYCGAPIIEMIMEARDEPSQLVFRAWNPFSDIWSGYFLQLAMVYLSGVITASWTTLTSVLTIIPTCELKILNIELEGMVQGDSPDYRSGELEGRVIAWVEKHVKVIRYVESLDRVLNHILLIDFLVYGGIFCSILFEYSIMGFTFEIIVAFAYMLTMIILLLLIYWTGNEVMIHSKSLAEAAYKSTWYKAPNSFKTSILIIMHRSQSPLKLRVWKLYDVSMATCLKISSTAYSYFAIIRHVYAEK